MTVAASLKTGITTEILTCSASISQAWNPLTGVLAPAPLQHPGHSPQHRPIADASEARSIGLEKPQAPGVAETGQIKPPQLNQVAQLPVAEPGRKAGAGAVVIEQDKARRLGLGHKDVVGRQIPVNKAA